jgi:chromosomal replication initiation ATPase DnaA
MDLTPISSIVDRMAQHAKDNPRAASDRRRSSMMGGAAVNFPSAEGYLRSCLVTARFEEVSFDSFEPATVSQRVALNFTKTWVARALEGSGPLLALIGSQGCGKSHLLYAAVHALLPRATGKVYARPWYRLADELRYGGPSIFASHLHDDAHDVRERLWKHAIVLIDEVRPTSSTLFDDTELAKLSCHAYDARVAVLITTNVDPLSDVMGAPAASRFTQLIIEGPDRRQQ